MVSGPFLFCFCFFDQIFDLTFLSKVGNKPRKVLQLQLMMLKIWQDLRRSLKIWELFAILLFVDDRTILC